MRDPLFMENDMRVSNSFKFMFCLFGSFVTLGLLGLFGIPCYGNADERESQIAAGRQLLAQIRKAAMDPDCDRFVIPPGDYGFTMSENVNGVPSGFALQGIRRLAERPFCINGSGSTFWFDLPDQPAPHVVRALYLADCEHVRIENLTLDSWRSNTIEGSLTRIDHAKNRIEIALDADTITDPKFIRKIGSETRIIPVKASGEGMPALYDVNGDWGPGHLFVKEIQIVDESEGASESVARRLWLTFKTDKLLVNTFTHDWKARFGSRGMLEPGDRICLLYGVCMGVALDNCKQIGIDRVRCWIGKASFWENGGYGDHRWTNCVFAPRAGSNRILGGEGNMTQGLRHGSTFDHLTMKTTSDDAINIHGFFSRVQSCEGRNVRFRYAPVGIQAGDPVEFYDSKGTLIQTNRVRSTPVADYNYNGFLRSAIELERSLPERAYDLYIRWPNSECAGWKITNSTFENVYQRILIECGPGVFENNRVLRMGACFALDVNLADYEGGFLRGIVVRGNHFTECPRNMSIRFIPGWQTTPERVSVTEEGNVWK